MQKVWEDNLNLKHNELILLDVWALNMFKLYKKSLAWKINENNKQNASISTYRYQ